MRIKNDKYYMNNLTARLEERKYASRKPFNFKELDIKFVQSAEDPLKRLANDMIKFKNDGIFVGGGSCISLFKKEHAYGDIDIWTSNEPAFHEVARYLTEDLECQNIDEKPNMIIQDTNYDCNGRPYDIFRALTNYSNKDHKYQIILNTEISDICHLLTSFDLEICRIAFDKHSMVYSDYAITDINNKTVTCFEDETTECYNIHTRIEKYVNKRYAENKQLNRHGLWMEYALGS